MSSIINEWRILPADLLDMSLSFLDAPSLARASAVSKEWQAVANTELLWKNVLKTINPHNLPITLPKGVTAPKQHAKFIFQYLAQFKVLNTREDLFQNVKALAAKTLLGKKHGFTCLMPNNPTFKIEWEFVCLKGEVSMRRANAIKSLVNEHYILLQELPEQTMRRGLEEIPYPYSVSRMYNSQVPICEITYSLFQHLMIKSPSDEAAVEKWIEHILETHGMQIAKQDAQRSG